jgi:hypothetical protein
MPSVCPHGPETAFVLPALFPRPLPTTALTPTRMPNLMGEYAAANHEVIHRNVSKLLGERPGRARREPPQLRVDGEP